MNGELQKACWLDRNYRWLMLAGMGIELLLISALVVLEVMMVAR